MVKIEDYQQPFNAIRDFEIAVADYTGAPYCVSTDSCTHAIEIAFRLAHNSDPVSFPAKTYLSVLMTFHKLGIKYKLVDQEWKGGYRFQGSNIWDCARMFDKNMYEPGTIQCLSFGRTKPLQVGAGGCILTDNKELFERASRMRYDGRDLFAYDIWADQTYFEVGYHYYMRPEECVKGLNLLHKKEFIPQLDRYYNYPDCRAVNIK